MEWNFGSRDVVFDRIPSPENFSDWGISDSESFSFPDNCNFLDSISIQEQLNFNAGFCCNEVEIDTTSTNDKDQSSSSVGGGFSDDYVSRKALSSNQLAYQLDGLARFEQMDELFLNSLIEDPPAAECAWFVPELENDTALADHIFADKSLDTQSSGDTVSASQFVARNSELKHGGLVLSGYGSMNQQMDAGTCLEESVLREMEMVMSQFTDRTRICFRDALYRLANNSRQHEINENGNRPMGTPPWTGHDERIRTGGKKAMELETNPIDRAVANLMFNQMESNVHDFPVSASNSPFRKFSKPLDPVTAT